MSQFGIPAELLQELKETLLICGDFDDDRSLDALFVDGRIRPWKFTLPEASTAQMRVEGVIDRLHNQTNEVGENALVLFLAVLRDRQHTGSGCYGQLDEMGRLIAAELQDRRPGEPKPPSGIKEPYKGLLNFTEKDASLFFGREELTKELWQRLQPWFGDDPGEQKLAVVGASGSGKSSLVQAGLLPLFRAKQGWRLRVLTPTRHPLKALAMSIEDDEEEVLHLIDKMAADERILDIAAQKRLRPGEQLLLVVDQFEELFSGTPDAEDETLRSAVLAERTAFVANLLHAAAAYTAGPTSLILILRADFYHKCADYPALREVLENQQVYIGGMSGEELERAILRPAAECGYQLAPGLVEIILRDCGVAGTDATPEPGVLPLLSHSLQETWARREGATLTLRGYRAVGGVQGAIAATAGQAYGQLPAGQQEIARRLFVRLTEFGEGVQDTRRRVETGELQTVGGDEEEVQRVVQRLADARLVTTDEDGVEVAHEALIREWQELRNWVDEEREAERTRRRLAEAARQWARTDREESYLYRGARLVQAEEWAAGDPLGRSIEIDEFLTASANARDREVTEREAARQRELELVEAQRRAEAERAVEAEARVREQEEAARSLQRRNLFLVGAMVVAVVLALLAGTSSIRATGEANQRATAEARALTEADSRATAEAQAIDGRATAEAAQIISEEALLEAERQSRIALAQTLAALSRQAAELINDSELATLLAIEAMQFDDVEKSGFGGLVDSSLRPLLEETLFFNKSVESGVSSVAFSPDGPTLASGDEDGNVHIWDLSDPMAEPVILPIHEEQVMSVAFSPDGGPYEGHLASGSIDGTVTLWDLNDRETEPRSHTVHDSGVNAVAFSPDGRTLASGSDDSTVVLWDLSNPDAARIILPGHESSVLSVAFSPDGRILASGSRDNTVRLWDLSDLETDSSTPSDPEVNFSVLEHHLGPVNSVAFSPENHSVAYSAESKLVRPRLTHPATKTLVNGLVFGSESSGEEVEPDEVISDRYQGFLATGSEDGTVRLWLLSDIEAIPVTLRDRGEWIRSLVFSPDGRTLATGSEDGTVQLWNLNNMEAPPVILTGHENRIRSVAFSPDGQTVASGSDDHTIRLWATTDLLATIGCQQLGRNLTETEWEQYVGALLPYRPQCDLTRGVPSWWEESKVQQFLGVDQ